MYWVRVFSEIDPDLIIPNKDLSIKEGAIKASGWNTLDSNSIAMMYYTAIVKNIISLNTC